VLQWVGRIIFTVEYEDTYLVFEMCPFFSVGSCQNLFGCPKNCLVMWYLVGLGGDLSKLDVVVVGPWPLCVCMCVCASLGI